MHQVEEMAHNNRPVQPLERRTACFSSDAANATHADGHKDLLIHNSCERQESQGADTAAYGLRFVGRYAVQLEYDRVPRNNFAGKRGVKNGVGITRTSFARVHSDLCFEFLALVQKKTAHTIQMQVKGVTARAAGHPSSFLVDSAVWHKNTA